MAPALAMVVMASEAPAEWGARHVPPPLDLTPFTRAELYRWFKGGEPTADQCEKLLAWASRARGGLDLALAEGLHALQQGERLAELGFHLDDYGREVLDLGKRATETLALLGRELQARPLLREALRSGRVRLRAAETVLKVARGEAEPGWVERAATLTVRQLEAAVEKAGVDPAGEEEEWLRLVARLRPLEHELVDGAVELAGRLLPGSSRIERLEAVTQEFLGEHPGDPEADAARKLGPAFEPLGPAKDARQAALETETDRWAILPPVADWPAPDLRAALSDHPERSGSPEGECHDCWPEESKGETATAKAIDALLREVARLRAAWDDIIGFCAHAIRQSRMYLFLGFSSFEHYCDERLGLPARTVEQRAALERKLQASPALQEARRQKVPYEKLRLLARLPEGEIGPWTQKAHGLTCVALRRRLEGERERQLRARRKLSVPLPRRVAVLLAAACERIRQLSGCAYSVGKCLGILAWHFIQTWKDALPRRTGSQRVRERDGGHCTVPGCSHRSAHSHHVEYRSQGGSLSDDNQTGACGYHHLDCIHRGHLHVSGLAPDGLTWKVGGEVFTGR
jgi:hypothetical protein